MFLTDNRLCNLQYLYEEVKWNHNGQLQRLAMIDSRVREISVFSFAILTGLASFRGSEMLLDIHCVMKVFVGLSVFGYFGSLLLCLQCQSKNKLIRTTNIQKWFEPDTQGYRINWKRAKWSKGQTKEHILLTIYDTYKQNEQFILEKGKCQEWALWVCFGSTVCLLPLVILIVKEILL